MNQHQFPPDRLAILFIRLNVPPRNVDVDEKASFYVVSTGKMDTTRVVCGTFWQFTNVLGTHHA